MQRICLILSYLLCVIHVNQCFQTNTIKATSHSLHNQKTCYLFNFFNKPKSDSQASVVGKVDTEKIKNIKLEKISNTQNRDWKAEAQKQPIKMEKIQDLQKKSYNFGKPNEFPNLYEGWIKASGDQIAKQIISSTKSAIAKSSCIEVLFDPVPNLDEVAFGTAMNKKFRLEASSFLGVPDYATNRGGSSTLEWSNIYWAARLVAGLKSPKAVAISLSGEGTKGQFKPVLPSGMRLLTLADAKKVLVPGEVSLLIILSPCQEGHYKDGTNLATKLGVPIVALNSPFSYRYDIGGGAPYELAYVMKRIPKGWIFRMFPGRFQAIIEGPDYEVFKASEFETQPALTTISKVSTEASTQKYGATGNDRIFENRL